MTGRSNPSLTRPRRVGLVSLGCAKNLVDGEIMLGALLRDGFEIVNDPAQADALIVNTCSFIDAAQEESVEAILEAANFRADHRPDQVVIVSGCLPQRFRDDLPKLLPEVDAFMGIDQVEQVSRIVEQAVADRARSLESTKPGPAGKESRNGIRAPRTTRVRVLTKELEGTKPPSALKPQSSPPKSEVAFRPSYIPHWDTPRFRLTPRHFAYVKIAEGCNHPCSFCIIPRMRGGHRSRGQSDIVEEAKRLLADGVKELNLISQDSTYYGLDLRPQHSRAIASPERFTSATRALGAEGTTLCTLLRELNSLPGEFWIRLLYTHPAHWTDELIATIAACSKVVRYVDMPLQHVHDDLLARMRRETSGKYIRDLIRRIRAGIPGIALRTTFIVGFPGETPEHFETLLDFIRETRFERLGVFTYSQEDGTIAGRMVNQVPVKTRLKRRDLAMAEQHRVATTVAKAFVGRTLRTLVEGRVSAKDLRQANVRSWEHGLIREKDARDESVLARHSYSVARGESDAPDIDGRIYIRARLPIGEFAEVRITGHTDYDLLAEPV